MGVFYSNGNIIYLKKNCQHLFTDFEESSRNSFDFQSKIGMLSLRSWLAHSVGLNWAFITQLQECNDKSPWCLCRPPYFLLSPWDRWRWVAVVAQVASFVLKVWYRGTHLAQQQKRVILPRLLLFLFFCATYTHTHTEPTTHKLTTDSKRGIYLQQSINRSSSKPADREATREKTGRNNTSGESYLIKF